MTRLIVRGGRVLSPSSTLVADVLIDGEQIAGITMPNVVQWPDAQEIDASGCYVLPGVVDAHTHIQLDTGLYRTDDDWAIGTRAAAYGGVTTVVDFATQFAGQSFPQALEQRLAECRPAYIDYALHMMVTDLARDPAQARADLAQLRDMGVPSIKLYTTYRPNYYADDAVILHTLRAMPGDMLALFHCENDLLVADATQRLVEAARTGWRYHGESRPAAAETEAALRVAHLAETAGDKAVYIVHCSAAQTVDALAQFRQQAPSRQAWLYFETCIQYLLLDAALYQGPHPEWYILQPPLRDLAGGAAVAAHLQALAAETAVLSTDHCDYSLAQKSAANDFRVTPGGLPGLETLLPLTFTLFSQHPAAPSLNRMVEVLATNPAKLFGLYPQKGILQAGSDADLVIYDPAPQITIQAANLHSVGGYSPYENHQVQGQVRYTIARGNVLVAEGKFVAQAQQGRGRFLKGQPFRPLAQW